MLQMMLNTPAGISPAMDIAKMEAMHAVVQRRASGLTVLRELRAGLFSLPSDEVRALGQLASATRTAMALEPDILHVVGHTEADHAIEADELITSCTLVRQVVDDALLGLPDLWPTPQSPPGGPTDRGGRVPARRRSERFLGRWKATPSNWGVVDRPVRRPAWSATRPHEAPSPPSYGAVTPCTPRRR